MRTIWRKQSSNVAPKVGLGYISIIRRGASGWKWLLMMQDQCVSHGIASTKLECQESVRTAKAQRECKPIRAPLAPTGKRGVRI